MLRGGAGQGGAERNIVCLVWAGGVHLGRPRGRVKLDRRSVGNAFSPLGRQEWYPASLWQADGRER